MIDRLGRWFNTDIFYSALFEAANIICDDYGCIIIRVIGIIAINEWYG